MTLQALKGAALFGEMEEPELQELATYSRCASYARGATIVFAGEESEWSHLIARAKARLYRIAPNAKLATVSVAHAGDILPVLSERTFLEAAADRTVICRIPKAQLLRVETRHPVIAMRVREALAHRLQDAYDHVEELICLDMRGRVGRTGVRSRETKAHRQSHCSD
jgi:CRP-like cAMP-binding protein